MDADSIRNALMDLLWPPRCAACSSRIPPAQTSLERRFFCAICGDSLLTVSTPLCSRCGLPFDGTGPDHLCAFCLEKPPPFEKARAAFHYGGALAQALWRFKYGKTPSVARPLSLLLQSALHLVDLPDMVVPVPLASARLSERGFNQAALLAAGVARAMKAPLRTDILWRARDTAGQAGLGREARLANLQGAFRVRNARRIERQDVLLVDDVITTTATAREAATVLAAAGARSVQVIALARSTASGRLAPLPQRG